MTATAVDLVLSPFSASAGDMVDAAVRAERDGLADGVWTYDHLVGTMLGRGRSHDPFTVLGAIAGATERVRVGPLVANMMNRHPVALTLAAATLQSLSGGRAVLGIGSGAAPGSRFAAEHDSIGTVLFDGAGRRAHLAETIEVVRAMWADPTAPPSRAHGFGRGTHRGERYLIDDMADLVGDEPAPPIIVGASGPATTELALDHADGVNLRYGSGTADLVAMIADRARPAFEPGSRPDFEVSCHVDVAVTTADDRRRLVDLAPLIDRITVGIGAPFDLAPLADLRQAVEG